MKNPSKEQLDNWHKNPENWKFGGIYYNKDDERLFPPKKVAWMGWTVNFANPKSVVLFVVILVIAISLPFFLPKK